MSTGQYAVVQVSRQFNASAERVFDAWLDAKNVGRWLFATPEGEMVRVEVAPHVGGTYAIVERRNGQDIAHTGEYLKIHRPQQLVFSFAVKQFSEESTKVQIDITPDGENCQLTLIQKNVLAEYAERSEQGWTKILEALAEVLA